MKPSEIRAYFEASAVSNVVLSHQEPSDRIAFKSMYIEEILQSLVIDFKNITLILETIQKRTRDLLSDNKRKMITIAFLVVDRVEKGNFSQEEQVMDQTEEVSEQIVAKIINDVAKWRMNNSHPWALKGFDPNSVRQNRVRNLFNGEWFGWRTELELDQSFANHLRLKNSDWKNDTAFVI